MTFLLAKFISEMSCEYDLTSLQKSPVTSRSGSICKAEGSFFLREILRIFYTSRCSREWKSFGDLRNLNENPTQRPKLSILLFNQRNPSRWSSHLPSSLSLLPPPMLLFLLSLPTITPSWLMERPYSLNSLLLGKFRRSSIQNCLRNDNEPYFLRRPLDGEDGSKERNR